LEGGFYWREACIIFKPHEIYQIYILATTIYILGLFYLKSSVDMNDCKCYGSMLNYYRYLKSRFSRYMKSVGSMLLKYDT
jgi:hypothetical protein